MENRFSIPVTPFQISCYQNIFLFFGQEIISYFDVDFSLLWAAEVQLLSGKELKLVFGIAND